MMIKEELTLEHKDILFKRLFDIQIPLSEYSFSNLYLFRDAHNYNIIEFNDDLFISGVTYDKKSYVMPLNDISNNNERYFSSLIQLLDSHDFVFPVPEEWLKLFSEEKYQIENNEDDTDYIFFTEKFRNYPGRKLHNKKNLLNQFLNTYTPTFEHFNSSNINVALDILENWQIESGSDKDKTDYYPCVEAIKNFNDLKLCGAIFMADGNPAGFLIGEEINNEMYGIHFAKGLRSVKGISQYMFSMCSEIHIEKYRFMNLEQDMGKDNLRNTKTSYMPDHLAKKYRVGRR